MSEIRRLDVALGTRSYPIVIGAGLLQNRKEYEPWIAGRHALIVTDSNVFPHYAATVQAALADAHSVRTLALPPGEQHKTLDTLREVFDALVALGASRDATVIALGGGVIGDLAGFAAACWMRGIACVQMPTSLLAMVDSSVGGKTAVDLPAGKNLVGAFHQPRGVVIDTATLETLPDRELRAGLAEVVKYGAIVEARFLGWLEDNAEALLARDPTALAEAITRSCGHKAAIVQRDETEQGDRAWLNFGHTFAHALETAAGYGTLLHGEAVAIGMVCAAELAAADGRAPAADTQRLRALLLRCGLPTRVPAGLEPELLLELMRLDKKAVSGALRLILWRGAGQAEIVRDVSDALILRALASNGT
jgi:3-dehydroquinate synthase